MDTLPSAVAWAGDAIEIIDQTRLPDVCAILRLTTVEAAVDAIRTLAVRGAPAIGGCGALAVVLGLDEARPATREDALAALDQVAARVGSARPTAVNLSWAVGRVRDAAARDIQAAALANLLERQPVFRPVDSLARRADHLHAVLFQYAGVSHRNCRVQAGLPAQGRQQSVYRVRTFGLSLQNLFDSLRRDRLDVGAISKLRVGHYGGRV